MKSTQQALKDAIIPGLVAGGAALATVAMRGRHDSGSAIAPINASSHVLWGDQAARVERMTFRHTLPGLAVNVGAGLWWALVYEKLFGDAADRRGPAAALLGGAATAGIAYLIDYRVLPKRLTPGWEERISDRSLFMGLGALALGLGHGAMVGGKR